MKYDMNSMKRLLCLVCCFYWLSVIVYGSKKTSSFYLAELKCENLIEPLGIDNVTPHFSWKLKGDGWKGGQTYYEIQDRKSTRLNSSHYQQSRMPSSA